MENESVLRDLAHAIYLTRGLRFPGGIPFPGLHDAFIYRHPDHRCDGPGLGHDLGIVLRGHTSGYEDVVGACVDESGVGLYIHTLALAFDIYVGVEDTGQWKFGDLLEY